MSRKTQGQGRGKGKRKQGKPRSGWVENLRSLAVAVVLFLLLRSFVVQTFVITSGSMEDTLLVGDFLVVNRAAIGSRIPFTSIRIPGYSRVQRGDVLVFDPPHTDEFRLVKRLIGLPGDTIEMRARVVLINGQPLDEPYLKHEPLADQGDPWMTWQADFLESGVDRSTYRPTRDNWGPLVIPEDRYLMLGDNREESLDSRYWGLLEGWRLEGRVSFIYFSYDRESFKPFPFVTEIRGSRILHRVH